MLASALFMLAHECGHIAALVLSRQHIRSVTVNAGRFEIETGELFMSQRDELFSVSAGITVNFLLSILFLSFGLTEYAAMNLGLGLFNALPAGDLDGGKLLRISLKILNDRKKEELIHNAVSFAVAVIVMTFGFLVLFRNFYNLSVLIAGIYIFVTVFKNIRYTSAQKFDMI